MRMHFDASMDAGVYRFVHRVRVRFAETDAMTVVHHSAYFLYLEEARVEFLRSLGHPYDRIRAEGLNLPTIEVATQFRRPLRFDDIVAVHVMVGSVAGATFQMNYLLTVEDKVCALAVTVHAVVADDGRAARIPGWLRDLHVPS